jgi:nitrilase
MSENAPAEKALAEKDTFTVATVQAASIPFDLEASLDKAHRLTLEAAEAGARLVLFPEAFISGYPSGLSFGTVVGKRSPEGRRIWERYWYSSVEIPSAATEKLAAAAREAGVFLAMGVIEKDTQNTGGTLYCTLLYFGPDGRFLGKHRKLKPTAAERYIWGEGDGSTLPVFTTEVGKIGGLICWENYMPLARMTMYSKGVQVYLAPTADSRESWQATIRHIACEGRCYVLGCNQYFTRDMYAEDFEGWEELRDQPEVLSRGGRAIISPLGKVLAGPLFDQEGILTAQLDLAEVARGKFDFDVVGHYSRPDVFQLIVNEGPAHSVLTRRSDD